MKDRCQEKKKKKGQGERKGLKMCPRGVQLSRQVCAVGPVTEFVTIACRVLLTFPSAAECV